MTHDRLLSLAGRSRASGPALVALNLDLDTLRANAIDLAAALEELNEAAQDYDEAPEGREGAEDRSDAWERAQQAASQAADSYGAILLAHSEETMAR